MSTRTQSPDMSPITPTEPKRLVILAAGFATRLYPLTKERAKPLLDIAGRPVLSRLLDRVLEIETLESAVLVSNARFREQFESWVAEYATRLPITIADNGVRELADARGGIADLALGIQELCDSTPSAHDEATMVVAGDNLVDFDLGGFANAYREHGEALVAARRLQPPIPPRRYGEIQGDEHGRVLAFREKPAQPTSELAATGLYIYPPGIGEQLDAYLGAGNEPDAPGHFLAWLVTQQPLRYHEIDASRLHDIGNHESLETAQRLFADR